MKISYTITTQSCPSCGHIFSRFNDLWLYILLMITFPISIPTLIAFNILSERVFSSPQIPSIGNPIKTCPKCGLQIKSGKKERESLSKLELLNHQFKWLFRLSYLLGGIAILFLLGFILGLFDYDNTVLYCLYISISSVFIISIIAVVYKRKVKSINTVEKSHISIQNNTKTLLSSINPVEIAKITKEIDENRQNKHDAFYQHLILIVRDFAVGNGLYNKYKEFEMDIGASIRSHLRVYEAMFGQFYISNSENNRNTVLILEEFSFAIGIYYLYELNKVFPSIRVGDIIGVINEYEQEQFNTQMSLLSNPDLDYISREDLIQIIKERF
ncbi:MAG: hypothetical protein J6C93_06360 [Clostridia bacterium]|nr:hypothetical protein [Clostridia bacterium]